MNPENKEEWTSIKITKKVRNRLKTFRIYRRDTYVEIIDRALDALEKTSKKEED